MGLMTNASDRIAAGFVPRGRHLLVYDLVATLIAIVGAFTLRFDARDPIGTVVQFAPVSLLPLVVQPLANVAFGLYRREWRYASVRELLAITAAVGLAGVVDIVAFLWLSSIDAPGAVGLPRSYFPLEAILCLLLIGGGRFALRIALENGSRGVGRNAASGAVRTLVYGAGAAGAAMVRLARRDLSTGMAIIGFLDDDPAKRGSRLHGIRIHGGLDQLARAVSATGATQLVVAMPSAPGSSVRAAVDVAQELGLAVRIVPPLDDLLGDAENITRVRPVNLDDLLRRESAKYDKDMLARYLNGASVLVTGGGGSIGAELVRQVMALGPRRLTVVDHSEFALWSIERELRAWRGGEGGSFEVALADVRSSAAIEKIMERAEPDVVFHAAALKHVPVCEVQPAEAVLTNVIGTRNVVAAAGRSRVARFILISTDKAVQPVSVMGATKRLAELVTVELASTFEGSYAAVRFGNVLGSSGSVVPIFKDQLERGLPLTVTHPDATRFFMSIPEAVTLILEAGSDSDPGEIYLLDMGDPVRILDLANDMIRLSGIPPENVQIVFTGLRPGERLHEALLFDHESFEVTHHARVMRTRPRRRDLASASALGVAAELEKLAELADDRAVRELLITAGVLQVEGALVGASA
jgi:FlaA1/EpsC-like NDP-sugar epimerase